MSEQQRPEPESDAAENVEQRSDSGLVADIQASVEGADRVRTGDIEVDGVIDDVAAIGDRPLAEQPAAFDEAHERLRRVLDSPSSDGPA